MGIKDTIGNGLMNFIYPYMQNYYRKMGEKMPKQCDDIEMYKLKEKYLWFLGDEDLLADFYQTRTSTHNIIDTKEEYYYNHVGDGIRVIHSGFPSLISYTKARVLMTNGIEVEVGKENNENEDTEKTQLLKDINSDNKMNTIIKNSITTESWAGKFAWKISYDPIISEFPIIEKYNPFNYDSIYKRGRLQEIIFKTYYDIEKEHYELHEIYGTGYIKYELYQVIEDNLIPKALTDLEETSELKDIDLKRPIMLAGEKICDKSDYDGMISEFDALDETWSQLMDEIRKGRSETYIPEVLLQNKTFDKFRKNYAEIGTDERESGKNEIKTEQPDIRASEYEKTINVIKGNILIAVGISPFTVGINDTVGANSSGDSLTKRETATLRTREEMIDSWKEFIEEMFIKILEANDYFKKKVYIKYWVEVSFGKYITPSKSEVIADVKQMKDSDIIDVERALYEIYGDELSEEEKTRILANTGNIYFERSV